MKDLSVDEQIYLCKYHDIDTWINVLFRNKRKRSRKVNREI